MEENNEHKSFWMSCLRKLRSDDGLTKEERQKLEKTAPFVDVKSLHVNSSEIFLLLCTASSEPSLLKIMVDNGFDLPEIKERLQNGKNEKLELMMIEWSAKNAKIDLSKKAFASLGKAVISLDDEEKSLEVFAEDLSKVVIDEFEKHPDDFKSVPEGKRSFLCDILSSGKIDAPTEKLISALIASNLPFEADLVDFSQGIKNTHPMTFSVIERRFLQDNVLGSSDKNPNNLVRHPKKI